MSVRLFPDIIAASEVRDSLNDVVLICKNNDRTGPDNFFKEISSVYVSAERCARRQNLYAKRGLGNVFLGYNGNDWTVDDFKNYFDSNPSRYRRIPGNKAIYEVNLGNGFRNVDSIEDGKIQSCISDFCFGLLTQETYNPRILEKFGIEQQS